MASQLKYTVPSTGDNITVNAPQWGYDSLIYLPFVYARRSDGDYSIYDRGADRDIRLCSMQHLLNGTDHNTLMAFLEASDKLRANPVRITPISGGFTPFGPDLGDAGDFDATIINFKPSKQLHRPWLWWTTDLTVIMRSKPVYSLPATVSDGTVSIGNVGNIRYPQDGYGTEHEYGYVAGVTNGSDHFSVDRGVLSDLIYCEPEITATKSKMAELINEIVTNIRGNTFSFDPSANNYPFGRQKTASGPFTAIIGPRPVLRIKHAAHDKYRLILNMILRADNG